MNIDQNTTEATIDQNSPVVLLARVQLIDGTMLTAAKVDSITANVYANPTPTSATAVPVAFVKADVVKDVPPTNDPRWKLGSKGPNLILTFTGDQFPDACTLYRVEVKITPAAGFGPAFVLRPWLLSTRKVYSV